MKLHLSVDNIILYNWLPVICRSIFIEKCTNCVLVLACQQLRIHEAVDCTFFIHVTSKAIIEDSKGETWLILILALG